MFHVGKKTCVQDHCFTLMFVPHQYMKKSVEKRYLHDHSFSDSSKFQKNLLFSNSLQGLIFDMF